MCFGQLFSNKAYLKACLIGVKYSFAIFSMYIPTIITSVLNDNCFAIIVPLLAT